MKANYRNSTKYLTCFSLMLLLLGSCKKGWLEEKPDKTLTVPLTITEFQALLDNVKMINISPGLEESASDEHYVTDVYLQSLTFDAYRPIKDAYIWSKTGRHLSSEGTNWNPIYENVLADNVVLDGLGKIDPGPLEKEQWKNTRGQALLHRARIFFELAQIYAQSFNPTGSNEGLGIVMRLSSDITIPSKRSTVKETYEQILKDLNEAKDLLPSRPKILTRGSASAANALLARVYLSMGDYENAFIAADNCLKQYSELLDYNEISANNVTLGLYNKEVIWHTSTSAGFGFMWLIDRDLFDLYNTYDLRKARFFTINTDQSISYKGTYNDASLFGVFFNGLATDEVYLTRAECYARAGKVTEALSDLNTLMIKRWDNAMPFVPYAAVSSDEALQLILIERKKELLLRGTRWMDLKRLNREPRFAVTLTRTALGTTHTLEPNSYKYALPIPDNIIEVTGIPQNPGWQQ